MVLLTADQMEGNVCDFSHLDDGALIPPRKRLLAGFNKQNSSDQSCGSNSASPPSTGTEAKNLLGSPHSLEEVAESSSKAALAAAKVAETARTVAEGKAAIAARAIAAAKAALDLVAAFYEEPLGRGSRSKKNKSKGQAAVRSMYNEHDEAENESTDEEQLRQVIYRTPGLSKYPSSSSDFRSLKHKRPKISPVTEKTKISNGGVVERDSRAAFSGDAKLDTEGSSYEVAPLEMDRGSSITKLISSVWRMDNKDIVTKRRRARKQLIQMVERHVELG